MLSKYILQPSNWLTHTAILLLVLSLCCWVQMGHAGDLELKVDTAASVTVTDNKAMDDKPDRSKQENIWRQGTVKFMSFEGGFFGIVDDNGTKLLPMTLAPEFRQHGTIIKFKGKPNHEVMTIMQWGTPFELTEVELVKAAAGSAKGHDSH